MKTHLKMSSGKWQPFCLGLGWERLSTCWFLCHWRICLLKVTRLHHQIPWLIAPLPWWWWEHWSFLGWWFISIYGKMNRMKLEQNGQHFGGTIFKRISFNLFEFLIQFHWNMFMRVELMISQHQFRWWLGTEQATNHYLNQCWQRSEATRFH